MALDPLIQQAHTEIERQLDALIAEHSNLPYASLFSAARYSLLAGGKRLRPLLVIATAASYGAPLSHALQPACALEMVHTYSLIHDDLPCMDDDDLRRGRPTLHKVYPEWHALLAGDFLLTHAFEVLANATHLTDAQKIALVRSLASYSGGHGMIGGQMIDLLSVGKTVNWSTVELMHRCKTAGLLIAAVEFGAIIANVPPVERDLLKAAAESAGIAFQLVDDILDETGIEKDLGKTIGSDRENQKATAATFLGLTSARAKADALLSSAQMTLQSLSRPVPLLSSLFDQLVNRHK